MRISDWSSDVCSSDLKGVDTVAVSLTHEQALVEFDPQVVKPEVLLQVLRDIGYTIHDPNKLRPFEEEERELVREGRRFLVATAFSLLSVALISEPSGLLSALLPAVATVSLVAFVFLVLRSRGLWPAIAGAGGLGTLTAALLALKSGGALAGFTPWLVGGLAATLLFGIARHILLMAVQAVRRRILNQHVLLEAGAFAGLSGDVIGLALDPPRSPTPPFFPGDRLVTPSPHVLLEAGAFAGLAGGVIGLALDPPSYPTAPFFAVAVMVATYHLFSEWLSLIVKTRSSQAVKRLLDLQPETAHVLRNGREVEIVVSEVAEGDLVRIRPGERLAVDGEVVEGRSAVDQSLVTGEPMPVDRQAGDKVIGGTINGTGTLLVRVTAVGADSFLQRVAREVEDARALKPGLLHLVDRVLRVYTPAVLTVAVLAFAGWALLPQVFGFAPDLERAVFAGLSVLVMGYPCAVGISAPLSIVRGAGEAAEKGILMRTGEAFQGYRLVTRVAFDKTGTLTEGRPRIREIEAISGNTDELLEIGRAHV